MIIPNDMKKNNHMDVGRITTKKKKMEKQSENGIKWWRILKEL